MAKNNKTGENVKIYTLSDTYGNVFYVGCTITSLELRLGGHLSNARSTNAYDMERPKNKLIASLDFNIVADVVDMRFIEGDSRDDVMKQARAYEKEWIYKYMRLGFKLCNREAKVKKIAEAPTPDFVGLSIVVKGGRIDSITSKGTCNA